MALDDRYDLPAELWSKIIAFVLSDSIYSVCCAGQDVDLSWDQNAFGTLRLVSTSFSDHAVKVAELAFCVPQSIYVNSRDRVDERQAETDDDIPAEAGKLKYAVTYSAPEEVDNHRALYEKFKLLDSIRSGTVTNPTSKFFTISGISLLSAYYGYVQLIKNSKLIFTRDAMTQHDMAEKIYRVFPVAFRGISVMLDLMAVPEMVGKLRRDVERDGTFVSSGLEIIYNLSQTMTHRDWHESSVSEDFKAYLDDLYETMKRSSEMYNTAIKQQESGQYPTILRLPGVKIAAELILSHDTHHEQLTDLVRSWH